MAEAALTAALSVLLKTMATPSLKKLASYCGVEKDLKKLQSKFTALQAVLQDAEEQQWTNHTMRDWLGKLQDVAYDVQDILDEFATEDLRYRVEINNRTLNKVSNFFTPSNPVVFQFKMAPKVKEVVMRLDEIAKERFDFNLSQKEVNNRWSATGVGNPTHSFVDESDVFGRKDDKEKLVQLLTDVGGAEIEEDVSIVAVVGMGGLGKTTIAKLIYNDERVQGYFDQRIWAFVSQNFDMGEIAKAIIASATGVECDLTHMDPLQSHLRNTLSRKKFFLVLDDVWCENQEQWLELKGLLKVGAGGSKVLVTTRGKNVASIVGSLPTYHLEGLSEDDCWSLFKQRAFPQRDEQLYQNLLDIGKEIVKRSRGVPLAAKALGGLLHEERREREWLRVKDAEIWKLNHEDQILSSLRLSYSYLPSCLKQCFAYCSVVPKGYPIEKDELIQMWIAQGFIETFDEEREQMEDVGGKYFDELCRRSLLQEEVERFGGKVVFKLHDLIHDLATECLVGETRGTESVLGRTRHSSFGCTMRMSSIDHLMSFHNAEKLRTFILFGYTWGMMQVPIDISVLTCLRVLNFSRTRIKTLPNSIGKLKHLRYLDLSHSDIKTLPKSICTLRNLQTLKLLDCFHLEELPSKMWKMISLRHLEISETWKITQMPKRIGELSNLQTLSLFIVGKESRRGISELQGCLNLGGVLNIKNLENVLNPLDAEKVGLREKQNLRSLGLSWSYACDDLTTAAEENAKRVIESLEPHSDLQTLSIEYYMGARFPLWLMDLRVPHLVEVNLISCRRCEILPPLSHLLCLEILTIQFMPNLKKWWSDEIRQVPPRVKKLDIRNCPKLTQLPYLPSLETLYLVGCNETLLMSVADYTAITSLDIGGFQEMKSLPEGLFINKTLLRRLGIWKCPKLKSLSKDFCNLPSIEVLRILYCGEVESLLGGLHDITSLKDLTIQSCHQLKSLPDEEFQGLASSLQYMCISQCDNLRSLDEGLQHLNALETLQVLSCPQMAALPVSLNKLTALQSLILDSLPKLTSLSEEIGNLTSLKELEIRKCPNLLGLPESLQKVTTLGFLRINECPCLKRRCARETGEDWHKIQHVPFIMINWRQI